jgi:hypothetical protein
LFSFHDVFTQMLCVTLIELLTDQNNSDLILVQSTEITYKNMDSVFSKLNYKEGQTIHVLNSPESFEPVLGTIPAEIPVKKEISQSIEVEFIIAFALSKDELVGFAKQIVPTLKGDAILWLAYPKGSSKKYKCDFNRDTCWQAFTPYNLLPVRQISIDDDWSALRFRKAEYIKNVNRKDMLA